MSGTGTTLDTAADGQSFDPAQHPLLSEQDRILVRQIVQFTQNYFRNPKFDSSHDFCHVMRVVRNAIYILKEESAVRHVQGLSILDARTVILAALLHDVGDKKYVDDSLSDVPPAKTELLRLGLDEAAATTIQTVVDGVSYSSEVKNPDQVRELIQQIPELAVVQDADRLDAIGAIGIGRCFTFGGARKARSLDDSIEHFSDKLLKLEGMMKTETGARLAARRSLRIQQFMSWWEEEAEFGSSISPS